MTALPVSALSDGPTDVYRGAVDNPTRMIGNTPLVRLRHVTENLAPGVELYGKAEWYNPGGSIKDRPALWMIRAGLETGLLTPGKILIDATSGNTGIGYALIGAALGLRVRLCLPANLTEERKRLLRAYGADIIQTDPLEGSDGSIREARRLVALDPAAYFYPDQYNNPANWRAHFESTGPEIWRQTRGRVTHFVAGLGTSGTFTGTGRYLRDKNPAVQLISVQPDSPFHGLDGIKHMPTAIVPGIYDPRLADGGLEVSTEAAHSMVKRLARDEGLLVGVSGAAAVVAALETARTLESGVFVTVFPDSANRYLGERFWEEPT